MKIQTYLLIFALGLGVLGIIVGEREREKRSDAIEQLGIARSELGKAKEKEEAAREAYHEADKAYAVAQALNLDEAKKEALLRKVQVEAKDLQNRIIKTIEADKALGYAESQMRRKRSWGGVMMIGAYLLILGILFYSNRKNGEVEPAGAINSKAAASPR